MAERQRSLWAWGWRDKFPDETARKGLAQMVGALLPAAKPALRELPADDPHVADPRVAIPDVLADFATQAPTDRATRMRGRAFLDLVAGFARDYAGAPDLVARPRSADLFAHAHPLSIKTAWNGSDYFSLPNRRLRVDDDSYLILNEGTHYGTAFRSERVMDCFCVFFRTGLAQELAGARQATLAQVASCGDELPRRDVNFAEHLRAHDTLVMPQMRALARAIDDGVDDTGWYEERAQALLVAMLAAEPGQRERADSIPGGQQTTDLAYQAAGGLERGADYLRQTDVDEMRGDLEGLIRRYPTQSIAVGLAVGFLIARAFR